MSYAGQLVVGCAVVGLAIASAWGTGCASIIGADDYQVNPQSGTAGSQTTGGGGSSGTSTTSGAAGDSTVTGAVTSATTSATMAATAAAAGVTGTTTGSGTGGAGGSGGGAACSGANPVGQRMCGPGKTCDTTECGPPLAFSCFTAGTGPEGSVCTSGDDCAPGLTCLHYNLLHACRTLCALDTDCPTGYRCTESFTCGSNPAVAGRYCEKPCSDATVAGSAGCGQGFKCNFSCDTVSHTPMPPTCDYEAGPVKAGGSCTSDQDCGAGFYCLSAATDAGTGACTQACKVNGDCLMGTCSGTLYCGPSATTYKYCK